MKKLQAVDENLLSLASYSADIRRIWRGYTLAVSDTSKGALVGDAPMHRLNVNIHLKYERTVPAVLASLIFWQLIEE